MQSFATNMRGARSGARVPLERRPDHATRVRAEHVVEGARAQRDPAPAATDQCEGLRGGSVEHEPQLDTDAPYEAAGAQASSMSSESNMRPCAAACCWRHAT